MYSPTAVPLTRSRTMSAVRNVERISEKTNKCRVFVGKFEETTWKSMARMGRSYSGYKRDRMGGYAPDSPVSGWG